LGGFPNAASATLALPKAFLNRLKTDLLQIRRLDCQRAPLRLLKELTELSVVFRAKDFLRKIDLKIFKNAI